MARSARQALALLLLLTPAPRSDASSSLDVLVLEHGDATSGPLPEARLSRLPVVFSAQFAPGVVAPSKGPLRYLTLAGKPLAGGARIPSGGVRLLPVAPGRAALRLKEGLRVVSVLSVRARGEGSKKERPARRLALSRSLPPELALSEDQEETDEEAVELFFEGPVAALPSTLEVISRDAGGAYLDGLSRVPVQSAACPGRQGDTELSCATTGPLRLSVDRVERNHPALSTRTLVGEVGGSVLIRAGDQQLLEMVVGAPLALEPEGPGRYEVRVRTTIVRSFAGGPPAVGNDDEEAIRIVRDEIASASRLWGQCGITLGDPQKWEIEVKPPAQLSMLTVGCRGGFPATGGQIDLRVGGRRLLLRTHLEETPQVVATRLSQALRRTGVEVALHRNPLIESAALPSFDLILNNERGAPVEVEAWAGNDAPLTDDPTLGVCRGSLDLADGLDHFTDFDAASGTLEERVLLRGLMDDDPHTIDLLIVPVFSGVGRIGESFIFSPGVSIQNALILDRNGIRAGARSFTLAHELGHVLLALPGHPDDYGVDTPHSLMDADAADSTVFGPRRLSLEECRRALTQSGRAAPVPLIFDWPLPQHE